MEEKIIYQDSLVVIKHLPPLRASLIAWQGFPSHQKYVEAMESAYQLIKKEGLVHWISDQTHLKTLSMENQKWINEYFIPKVLTTAEVKKIAILIGSDAFTQFAMKKIRDELEKNGMPIRYFDNFADIQAWLQ